MIIDVEHYRNLEIDVKLSDWAKKQGISYQTAWRWVRDGKMPVPFEKTPSGIILVHDHRKWDSEPNSQNKGTK